MSIVSSQVTSTFDSSFVDCFDSQVELFSGNACVSFSFSLSPVNDFSLITFSTLITSMFVAKFQLTVSFAHSSFMAFITFSSSLVDL